MILYFQVKGDIFTKRKKIKLPILCYWIDKSKEWGVLYNGVYLMCIIKAWETV